MAFVPGTQTSLVYQEVASGNYPSLYYRNGETGPAMVSLNAGNAPALYVDGGGLNAAFQKILMGAGQNTNTYQSRHKALATDKTAAPTKVRSYVGDDNPTVVSSVDATIVDGASDFTGIAFADIFADAYCPGKNTSNRGMFYVAPPDGRTYSDVNKFKADIETTAYHGMRALNAYNSQAADLGTPVIQALRLSLYSSSIYGNKNVSIAQVARHIFAGIAKGAQADGCLLTEIQMPVTKGADEDTYFNAVMADHPPS